MEKQNRKIMEKQELFGMSLSRIKQVLLHDDWHDINMCTEGDNYCKLPAYIENEILIFFEHGFNIMPQLHHIPIEKIYGIRCKIE